MPDGFSAQGAGHTPILACQAGVGRIASRSHAYYRNFRFDVYGRILFRKNIAGGEAKYRIKGRGYFYRKVLSLHTLMLMTIHSVQEYRKYTSVGLRVAEDSILWEIHYSSSESEKNILRNELNKIHQVMREHETPKRRVICSPPAYNDDIIDEAYDGDAGLYDMW